jgi:hypothetical protein
VAQKHKNHIADVTCANKVNDYVVQTYKCIHHAEPYKNLKGCITEKTYKSISE